MTICPRCGGSGKLPDSSWMRSTRLEKGLSLREVANEIGISASYLSDLERGRRNLSHNINTRFCNALIKLGDRNG